MAEYLIQSETLDDIADAINAKTGGSSAMTPAEMVAEIGSIQTGGSGWTTEGVLKGLEPSGRIVVDGYDPSMTVLQGNEGITNLFLTNYDVKPGSYTQFQKMTALETVVVKNLGGYGGGYGTGFANGFVSCSNLTAFDADSQAIAGREFSSCTKLNTIILRKSSVLPLGNVNAFNFSPFTSGGTGGTIYIPKALYDELGTGTANDYKAATNWSTIDGYGTITWAQIEGSQYEHYYADGTPVQTT